MKRFTLITISILTLFALLLGACTPKESTAPADGYPAPKLDDGYPAPAVESAYPAMTKVVVATDATFPPFEIVDETTKELTGFDVELFNALAQKAGFEVEWVNTPFDSVTSGVSTCQFDIAIAAMTITDERKESMLFSDPYINAGQIVVVQASNTEITGVADLEGKTIAAQLGTTGEIEAKNVANVTYKPYDTYDLAFLDLQNGQVDAVIADYPTALGFIGKNPDLLKTVGDVFTDESYGIAICKTKPELLDKVNTALKAVVAEGVVKQLEDKWLAGQ